MAKSVVVVLTALLFSPLAESGDSRYLSDIPDFTQTEVVGSAHGNGQQYCAPAAVSNSLIWLSDKSIEQKQLVTLLASDRYMNTDVKIGTGTSELLRGVDRYVTEEFGGYRVLLYQGWRKHPSDHSTNLRVHLYLERENVSIPASIYIMKSPNSYTREDIVEVHTFGSPPLLEMLMETLISLGRENAGRENNEEITRYIRIAEPGEFTKRAFLNGRISLAEAESVIHIIRSQTDSELLMSVANLKGKLTELMHNIQADLVNLCARTEAAIDFYDEGIELISFDEIRKELEHVKERLCMISKDGQKPKISHHGVKTVFIGWPNTGKSSLFNKLLNRPKAIVTQVRGTTRDTLEADMVLEGINFECKILRGLCVVRVNWSL